jgi:hypothetical protein
MYYFTKRDYRVEFSNVRIITALLTIDNVRDPSRSMLDQTTAIGAVGQWSGLFLRASLLGDQGASNYVYKANGNLDPNVNVTAIDAH